MRAVRGNYFGARTTLLILAHGKHGNTGMVMNETPSSDLTCARFAAVASTIFQVSDGGKETVPLKLVEVKERSHRSRDTAKQGESFSLLFTGPRTRPLPQRLYWFAHETMGRFELFIVPVGQDATSFSYEAVFNMVATG
jgi:hypothetical protein